MLLPLGTCALGTVTAAAFLALLTGELSTTTVASFHDQLRICMFSYHAMYLLVVPFDSLAS